MPDIPVDASLSSPFDQPACHAIMPSAFCCEELVYSLMCHCTFDRIGLPQGTTKPSTESELATTATAQSRTPTPGAHALVPQLQNAATPFRPSSHMESQLREAAAPLSVSLLPVQRECWKKTRCLTQLPSLAWERLGYSSTRHNPNIGRTLNKHPLGLIRALKPRLLTSL